MCCKLLSMKKLVTLLFIFLASMALYAQSADVITDLLESKEATFGQICYLAAVQQNLIDENDDYEKAVQSMYENKLIPGIEDANEAIPLVDIAYIYSKLWTIKGGLMYRITKGSPRYAFRQFQADGILTAKNEPSDIVSGAKALSIFTSCINKYSGFDMKAVSMEID